MVAAVVAVGIGRPDAVAVARVVAVAVRVMQVGADVPVHGGQAVGDHQDEVVLARALDGRIVAVAEVVQDRFHGLAQGSPGVGGDARRSDAGWTRGPRRTRR